MLIIFPFYRLFHRWRSGSSLQHLCQRHNRGGNLSTDENDEVTQNAPDNTDLWTDSGNYATSFAGGSGQEDDPYQIATAEELAYLAYLINGSSSSSWRSLYYEQTADIDLSAHYWDAIGYSSSRYFAGYYDGGGYIISNLFTPQSKVNTSLYNYQGLFGYVRGSSSSSKSEIKTSQFPVPIFGE